MQKEGNITWDMVGAHTWTAWVDRRGGWHWEVSGPGGWMATAPAAGKEGALEAIRQCLTRRGETVQGR